MLGMPESMVAPAVLFIVFLIKLLLEEVVFFVSMA
jgi:hypothetical protein